MWRFGIGMFCKEERLNDEGGTGVAPIWWWDISHRGSQYCKTVFPLNKADKTFINRFCVSWSKFVPTSRRVQPTYQVLVVQSANASKFRSKICGNPANKSGSILQVCRLQKGFVVLVSRYQSQQNDSQIWVHGICNLQELFGRERERNVCSMFMGSYTNIHIRVCR